MKKEEFIYIIKAGGEYLYSVNHCKGVIIFGYVSKWHNALVMTKEQATNYCNLKKEFTKHQFIKT